MQPLPGGFGPVPPAIAAEPDLVERHPSVDGLPTVTDPTLRNIGNRYITHESASFPQNPKDEWHYP